MNSKKFVQREKDKREREKHEISENDEEIGEFSLFLKNQYNFLRVCAEWLIFRDFKSCL